MPREKIHGDNTGNQPFEPVIGWTKDCDNMQIGIQVIEPRDPGMPDTLLKIIYGPNDGALTSIGLRLRKALEEQGVPLALDNNLWLGHAILRAVEDPLIPGTGVWWMPTRHGVNSLIRLLRKARDAAFGADA